MTDKNIIVNMIRTPDGTILQSRHRHDYVEYTDSNGCEYMVDGGTAYIRRGWTPDAPEYEELSLYEGDDHELIRERFSWGSYGKDGTEPLHYIKLKDITDEHLDAIMDMRHQLSKPIMRVFISESIHREKSWSISRTCIICGYVSIKPIKSGQLCPGCLRPSMDMRGV